MLKTDKPKVLPSQYTITQAQKLALIEGKIQRAEAHVKALTEIVEKLERKK
jgi:hypothetical protein